MILVILRERSTIGMGPEMVALYGAFPTLNPGQFRQIMKHAHWVEAEEETQICAQGVRPDHLVLISRGAMYIQRGGKQVRIDEGNFIGEISFLTNGAASADVVAPTGTQYVMWERVRLEALMEKSPRLSNAIGALLNKDIARKLGKSWPEALGG